MKLYIETYGCQMNFSDSEIIASVLGGASYDVTRELSMADVVLVNTCSIRENAEKRVLGRISELSAIKRKRPGMVLGVVGCMAERLKESLLELCQGVDIIAGPDAYRSLPHMLGQARDGRRMANVLLSEEETYDRIDPVRLDPSGVSAFISIMRGCNNYCTYCVVPYVRGRERSRDPETIIREAERVYNNGYREVTLLGQNVNSYRWSNGSKKVDFPELMSQVAGVSRQLRVRFATSHPRDISQKLIDTIAEHQNIARAVHLPVQSGSSRVLEKMNRKYTREWYLDRVGAIREKIPHCGITTDIITGFPGETEEDHRQTLSLMQEVRFDFAFMFKYSQRPGTAAAKRWTDDVPEEVKGQRLEEIVRFQQQMSQKSNDGDVGKTFEVLVEGPSKKDANMLMGRNSQNKVVVFPGGSHLIKTYVRVKVHDCTSATLKGTLTS